MQRKSDNQTGFEARTFQKGNEIVISYSGTDPEHTNLVFDPDGITNAALANGKWSDQLLQAAQYYLDIKAAKRPLAARFGGHWKSAFERRF